MELNKAKIPMEFITTEIDRISRVLKSYTSEITPSHDFNKIENYFIERYDDITLVKSAQSLIREYHRRRRFFPKTDFFDPAWNIIIDLFVARLTEQRISVSSACIASGVPTSTALRYISQLTAERTIIRIADPFDARRVYVELSNEATDAMRAYLQAEICNRPLSRATCGEQTQPAHL